MWVTGLGVLGSIWLLLVSADPWTGPGSFYTFSAKKSVSNGLISERAYYNPLLNKTIPWRNYFNLLMSPNMTGYPAAFMGNKSVVMVGDSTDEFVIVNACRYLISKASNSIVRVSLKTIRGTTYSQCRIRNGVSSLTISHIRLFGFKDKPYIEPYIVKKYFITETNTEDILRKHLKPQGLGIPGVPDYATLQSCLWDMNERKGIARGGPLKHYKLYPHVLYEYYDHAVSVVHLLRQLLPDAILVYNTCKPVNDKAGGLQPTRENHMTVALDNMIRLLANRGWEMDDIVDNGALLRGHEKHAEDGKHYNGVAAHTLLNAYLNAIEFVANKNKNNNSTL